MWSDICLVQYQKVRLVQLPEIPFHHSQRRSYILSSHECLPVGQTEKMSLACYRQAGKNVICNFTPKLAKTSFNRKPTVNSQHAVALKTVSLS